jgi:transposase, IS6 family
MTAKGQKYARQEPCTAANYTRSPGSYRIRPACRAQQRVLVPEYEQLGIFRPVTAEHQNGQAGYPARQQVDGLEKHPASQPSLRASCRQRAADHTQSSNRAAQDGDGPDGVLWPLLETAVLVAGAVAGPGRGGQGAGPGRTRNGTVALVDRGWRETGRVTARRTTSVFAGFRFPPEVIAVAVRWYLRYGLSYRDVEELLAERGITVDHVTIYRWVQHFTAEFTEAARPCRHVPGDRWFADETYVKVAGRWTYLYRAIDQHGQVIDVLLSQRRDLAAARRFFTRALHAGTTPAEVTTDRAPAYPRVLDELIPSALHTVERYANNPVEADHGRLKARLRPMRGLKRHRSAQTLAAGHAFLQNLRRGHYELATDVPARHRIRAAFDELKMAI